MRRVKKKQEGITLIALIITVIIMLILAGVAISALTTDGGLFSKTQSAVEKYNNAVKNQDEKIASLMNEMDSYFNKYSGGTGDSEESDETEQFDVVNNPKTVKGMIAVKYDTANGTWVKADETNTNKDWYDYSSDKKQWANIVTVKENGIKTRDEYLNAGVGTAIEMDDILTFFVWIPRYAYSITDGYKEIMDGDTEATTGKVDVKFLVGATNKDENGNSYSTDYDPTTLSAGDVTPMIVHPAFKFGEKELTGFWVAKFEASGVNDLSKTDVNTEAAIAANWTNYVGNRSATSSTPVAVTANTVLTVKPSVPSWRDIEIGDSQAQSMKLTNSTVYGWATNTVDGHLMKNTEWGAVTYLCYSEYGNIPMINACGVDHKNTSNVVDYMYNYVTGAGPKTAEDESRYDYNSKTFIAEHSYSTSNGQLASTTGNIYGIYDMSGGNWERIAGYLDNGNYNLKIYGGDYFNGTGGTTVDSSLKTEYEKYWDKYEVGNDEKANAIKISETETLTQNELWDLNKNQIRYNEARKRITGERMEKMISHKGDAMYEIMTIGEYSFYAPYLNGSSLTWDWFKVAYDQPDTTSSRTRAKSWNGDHALIGGLTAPFVCRGGIFYSGEGAGICASSSPDGSAHYQDGFRPVLAF